jgi:hypothetical protein
MEIGIARQHDYVSVDQSFRAASVDYVPRTSSVDHVPRADCEAACATLQSCPFSQPLDIFNLLSHDPSSVLLCDFRPKSEYDKQSIISSVNLNFVDFQTACVDFAKLVSSDDFYTKWLASAKRYLVLYDKSSTAHVSDIASKLIQREIVMPNYLGTEISVLKDGFESFFLMYSSSGLIKRSYKKQRASLSALTISPVLPTIEAITPVIEHTSFSVVDNHIFIGSDELPNGGDAGIEKLKAMQVTHILNIAAECPSTPRVMEEFNVLQLPCNDITEAELPLRNAMTFIGNWG